MSIREAVEKLFEYEEMGNRRFSRETYKPSFEKFEEIAKDFDEALYAMYEEFIKSGGGDEEALQEKAIQELCENVAEILVTYIKDSEEAGLSKWKKEEQQRLHNTFMVTYVLPHIMEMRNPYYKELAKEIEKNWAAAFKNSKIKAATFETIAGGFQRKFLGFSF